MYFYHIFFLINTIIEAQPLKTDLKKVIFIKSQQKKNEKPNLVKDLNIIFTNKKKYEKVLHKRTSAVKIKLFLIKLRDFI